MGLYALQATVPPATARQASVDASGYMEALPVLMVFDMPGEGQQHWWEYRVQNRLNLRWFATEHVSFTWEMRTRFFAGDPVRELPGYAHTIGTDPGFANLSWLVAEQDTWFVHYIPDRLFAEWAKGDWSVRAGRQRLNWGINLVTNPNDLFNIYSFYDFAYPERPGADAIRVQYHTGFASRVEAAFSPSRDPRRHVGAMLWQFNRSGYDVQLLAGYYRHRAALGGGWAGNIGQTGFKGEFTFFTDLDDDGNGRHSTMVVAASADHMFDSGLFLIGEVLWNSDGGRDTFNLFGEPLSADNPSFSRYQVTLQGSMSFSPLLSGSLAVAAYPDEEAVFVSPSITRSITENADLTFLGQYFAGSSNSIFSNAGYVVAAMFKWSF